MLLSSIDTMQRPEVSNAARFVQLWPAGIDSALQRLRHVDAKDPIAALGLLLHFVMAAEWRERGRGTLRCSKAELAEYFATSRWRIARLLEPLEESDLVRCEWVRGHDGSVLVLAYEEIVRVRQVRAPTIESAPTNVARARANVGRVLTDEPPARSAHRRKKEDLPEGSNKGEKLDIQGCLDVIYEQIGIAIEPTPAIAAAIRQRMAEGFSARHVGGEVDARTWPNDLESPEAILMHRLGRLQSARRNGLDS